MGEHIQASFDALTNPDQTGRFVLAGSMARAAMLNDVDFKLRLGSVERDVDIIDTSGELTDTYMFNDAAPIDAILTRRIRPVPGGDWGLYNPSGSEPEIPALTIPTGLIKLEPVIMPFADARITTFDPCTQLALRNIRLTVSGYNYKHLPQYRRLRATTHGTANFECNCADWQNTMNQYHASIREGQDHSLSEKAYIRVLWLAKQVAPHAFKRAQNGAIGNTVRYARGTDNDKYQHGSIRDTEIFQATA